MKIYLINEYEKGIINKNKNFKYFKGITQGSFFVKPKKTLYISLNEEEAKKEFKKYNSKYQYVGNCVYCTEYILGECKIYEDAEKYVLDSFEKYKKNKYYYIYDVIEKNNDYFYDYKCLEISEVLSEIDIFKLYTKDLSCINMKKGEKVYLNTQNYIEVEVEESFILESDNLYFKECEKCYIPINDESITLLSWCYEHSLLIGNKDKDNDFDECIKIYPNNEYVTEVYLYNKNEIILTKVYYD